MSLRTKPAVRFDARLRPHTSLDRRRVERARGDQQALEVGRVRHLNAVEGDGAADLGAAPQHHRQVGDVLSVDRNFLAREDRPAIAPAASRQRLDDVAPGWDVVHFEVAAPVDASRQRGGRRSPQDLSRGHQHLRPGCWGSVRTEDHAADTRHPDELGGKVHAAYLLAQADSERDGFPQHRHSGVVGRREPDRVGALDQVGCPEEPTAQTSAPPPACARSNRSTSTKSAAPAWQRHTDEIVARLEVEHPVLAPIIGLVGAARLDLSQTLAVEVPQHLHQRTRHRFSVFVGDVPGDHRPSGQRDVDVAELATGVDLDRERGLTRVFLTVGECDKPRLARRHRVPAGLQVAELVAPIVVGLHRPAVAGVLAGQTYNRALDSSAGVTRQHPSRQCGQAGRRIERRSVAGRLPGAVVRLGG